MDKRKESERFILLLPPFLSVSAAEADGLFSRDNHAAAVVRRQGERGAAARSLYVLAEKLTPAKDAKTIYY
jgi:hypothetical protein